MVIDRGRGWIYLTTLQTNDFKQKKFKCCWLFSAWNKYFASAGHRVRQSALRASHTQFVPVFCIWYTIEIWKTAVHCDQNNSSAPEINISPVPDTMTGSRHFVQVTHNSCRSSVYDILLKFRNLPVIVTGRKRILSVTHEIVPDSDRWPAVISCTGRGGWGKNNLTGA